MNDDQGTDQQQVAGQKAPGQKAAGDEGVTHYQVLARKYRPSDFSGLIGQEAMVRTLTNAFQTGRLAHAFILTGVRGVGKTTTARIIAKALNCIGPDGTGGPTIEPCGVCEHCTAIAEDRHVDVVEMDAASRTGVDDIRELIEGVRYRPVSARYKVYIIDEVHMLSRNAFNALLKTLEEPPEHVKFIFATTEIRKVPVTVLSRCQRFDLRRVPADRLAQYFAEIAETEGAKISPAALGLIARAADGSVRDGQSLLDQAITGTSLVGTEGGEIGEDDVRAMLGLADRGRSFDLLDALFAGDVAGALAILDDEYANGADPIILVQDLLELVHWLTRIKVVAAAAEGPAVPEHERVRGRDMADKLSMAALARAWQMLLKGLGEARAAPSPVQAVEMALVRLAYAAELPTPAEAVKALGEGKSNAQAQPAPTVAPSQTASPGGTGAQPRPPSGGPAGGGGGLPNSGRGGNTALAAAEPDPHPEPQPNPVAEAQSELADPQTFDEVVALADALNERVLYANLVNHVHLVRFQPGQIDIRPQAGAPDNLAKDLVQFLTRATGRRWMVSVSSEQGGETLGERQAAAHAARLAAAADHPMVREILDVFPGATIEQVRDLTALEDDDEEDGGAADGDDQTGDLKPGDLKPGDLGP